jgi:hypothetical protein
MFRDFFYSLATGIYSNEIPGRVDWSPPRILADRGFEDIPGAGTDRVSSMMTNR